MTDTATWLSAPPSVGWYWVWRPGNGVLKSPIWMNKDSIDNWDDLRDGRTGYRYQPIAIPEPPEEQ